MAIFTKPELELIIVLINYSKDAKTNGLKTLSFFDFKKKNAVKDDIKYFTDLINEVKIAFEYTDKPYEFSTGDTRVFSKLALDFYRFHKEIMAKEKDMRLNLESIIEKTFSDEISEDEDIEEENSIEYKYDDVEFEESQMTVAISRSMMENNNWIFLHTNLKETIKWLENDGWDKQGNGIYTYPEQCEDGTYKKLEIKYDENNFPILKATLIDDYNENKEDIDYEIILNTIHNMIQEVFDDSDGIKTLGNTFPFLNWEDTIKILSNYYGDALVTLEDGTGYAIVYETKEVIFIIKEEDRTPVFANTEFYEKYYQEIYKNKDN